MKIEVKTDRVEYAEKIRMLRGKMILKERIFRNQTIRW
jgi:hypothetical protein